MITPEVRKFEGYVSPQPQTGQIEGGKVLVIEYLYEREVHTLQLENNDGTEPKQLQMKQGAAIPAIIHAERLYFHGLVYRQHITECVYRKYAE